MFQFPFDLMSSLWDSLLFPTAYPALSAPGASFTLAPTTALYEVSSNQSVTFSTVFSRGSINPQYSAVSPYRSGLPNRYTFTGIGLVDVSSSSLSNSQAVDVSISTGYQTWTSTVLYDAGVQPYDSKGNLYSSPLSAGSVLASPSQVIEGVYPLFATTALITVLTKQSLVSMITGNYISFSMVAETGSNKQTFEIPNAWLSLRPLVGIQTYNTFTSAWDYELS